ncbi:response regulator [Fulvivirga lutea]|uniref:Response regulator n=1 Tax=Fulvivirga lutea TaxID=2810512 RepID=A0A974WKE0_9BACT|nr:response regulator [Fulvivirga lutea]QSE98827.1 response regulator [Fulvivirga lutea]
MINESNIVQILLVEDREEDGELALMGLESLVNNIKWVKDGAEALDFLFGRGMYEGRSINEQPRLILLDINLPKVNGLEVLKEIRSNPITKAIPVTILTTSKDEKDIYEAYNLGVNSYISKPVSFDQFSKTVKEVGMYWLVINTPHINQSS